MSTTKLSFKAMTHDEDRKARQATAMEAFWAAAKTGLGQLSENASEWRGQDARYYRAEADVFMEHVTPFYWGLATASFLFVTFRVTGSKKFQLYRETFLFGRPLPTITNDVANSPKGQWKSFLERQADQKAELAKELTRLPLDAFVSVMAGCSTILMMSNFEKLEHDFSEAPLMPGKSLIYESMCPAFENAFMEQDLDVFDGDDAGLLATWQGFVQNCRIRTQYIERSSVEGDSRSDVVPYPGLQGVTRQSRAARKESI